MVLLLVVWLQLLGLIYPMPVNDGCLYHPYTPYCRHRALHGDRPKISQKRGAEGDPSSEGSLVEVTVTSRVGVLLSGIPEEMEGYALGVLLKQGEEWWVERAKKQTRLTTFRLIFRPLYDEDVTHPTHYQLPLPDESEWNITFSSLPTVETLPYNLQVLVRDYQMKTYLLSDLHSPGHSDPSLASMGGSTQENFLLPLDPEEVFQRTGWACVDESEFPPNSFHPDNLAKFYDDTCTSEDPFSGVKCNQCHCSGTTPYSCQEALELFVGSVAAVMRFQRIEWEQSIVDWIMSHEVISRPHVGVSDMMPLPEVLSRTPRSEYRYIPKGDCTIVEKCIGDSGWRRIVMFDTIDVNYGTQDIHIGPIPYFPASEPPLYIMGNQYIYNDCHQHYHFDRFINISSHVGGLPGIAEKKGFCLQNSNRRVNAVWSPLWGYYYNCSYQGITSGWEDTYQQGIPCQWIDITNVNEKITQKGSIHTKTNPDNLLCEGNLVLDSDGVPSFIPTNFTVTYPNGTTVPVFKYDCLHDEGDLTLDNENNINFDVPPAGQSLVTQNCENGDQRFGELRNCAFSHTVLPTPHNSLLGLLPTCSPNSTVTLICSNPSTKPQVLRICEASLSLKTAIPCSHLDSLANQVLLDQSTIISFTCPSARDGEDPREPGGVYSVFSGAYFLFNNESAAPVSCTLGDWKAFKLGLEMGMEKGHREGYGEGFGEGEEEGYEEGLYKGYEDGARKGYEEGMEEGYVEGLKEGYQIGVQRGFLHGEHRGYNHGDIQGFQQGAIQGFQAGTHKSFQKEE